MSRAYVQSSQAVSSEIELPGLIERLMTIALENAGADRGLLICRQAKTISFGRRARLPAIGSRSCCAKRRSRGSHNARLSPRYVIRTRESVINRRCLPAQSVFGGRISARPTKPKSILCLPLIKQGRLTGLLYLENRLTSHAFTPDSDRGPRAAGGASGDLAGEHPSLQRSAGA